MQNNFFGEVSLSFNLPKISEIKQKHNTLTLQDEIFICKEYKKDKVIEIPEEIRDTYVDDYNILYVDEIIKAKLKQEQSNINSILFRLEYLYKEKNKNQFYIDKQNIIKEINILENKVEEIKSNKRLQQYISRSKKYIDSYQLYKYKIVQVDFNNVKEIDTERLYLVENYLDIAQDYINLELNRIVFPTVDSCINCSLSLENIPPNEEGKQICPECFAERDIITLHKISKDPSKVNKLVNDDSVENFLRVFDRYNGIQNRPPEYILEELDKYFIGKGRPSGEEIRKLPLNSRGRRGDTNHKMLRSALSKISRSEYYEDINLIGHIYWGWKLPDVQHLRESIIDKYNKTQKVFYNIPHDQRGRVSSLGTQYRLFKHLQLEGVECYEDEFKISDNPESRRIHDKLWQRMCNESDDPNIYYIP